jgi:hypothetical protein
LLNLIHIMDNSSGGNSRSTTTPIHAASDFGRNSSSYPVSDPAACGSDRLMEPPSCRPFRSLAPPPFIPGGGRAITGSRPLVSQPPPSFCMPPGQRGGETPQPGAFSDSIPPTFLRVNLRVPPPTHPPAVPLSLPPPLHPPAICPGRPFLAPHHLPPPPMGFPPTKDPAAGLVGPGNIKFPPPTLPRGHHAGPR